MTTVSLRKLRNSWTVQARVIHALMVRELVTRFGRENIGFLWVMVEPLLFAGLVGIVWYFSRGPTEHGLSVVGFVATGYIPITLFRHGVSRSVAVFTVNQSLLYHRQVKVIDFIISRFIIEVLGSMMAYLFMAIVLVIIGDLPVPSDMGLFLCGWFLYSYFVLAVCLIISPLSEMSEVLEKLIPVVTYIMIPFSGLFYLVDWVAPGARAFFLYSPFVNGMEMMRKGIWGEQITAYYDIWNPLVCATVGTLIGLMLCRHVRRGLAIE
ncbi:ABC transporter permease [Sphingomonas sp. GlSt437]|uniref:ABC transporter permease n=1 Tax=Sphingomonas sp. GlSt437 TaxID=3389970 RepID=UPI003A8544D2